jgi:predicted MFS family arabinose efflux permease
MGGLSTVAVGPALDRGRERLTMSIAMGAVSLSSLIALTGTTTAFAVAFGVLVLGVANYTVAGHAYISHRVDYRLRARSIGLFEVSWALALLLGAPVIAVLIDLFGWRGPFVALAVGAAIGALVVALTVPDAPPDRAVPAEPGHDPRRSLVAPRQPLTRRAWLTAVGSALTAMAGLSVFVVSGSWLDDQFGLSTGRLGLVAMGFGAIELIASVTSAGFADRLGKLRCTLAGLALLLIGLASIAAAGDRLALGVAGLLVFLLGFEFAFVTSLSLVSEAMPGARGRTLAVANGVGTVARGAGAVLSGVLYGAYGIGGTVTLSTVAAFIALTTFVLSRR